MIRRDWFQLKATIANFQSLHRPAGDKYLQGAAVVLEAALRGAEIAHCVTKKLPLYGQVLDIVLGPEEDNLEEYISPTVAPTEGGDY